MLFLRLSTITHGRGLDPSLRILTPSLEHLLFANRAGHSTHIVFSPRIQCTDPYLL